MKTNAARALEALGLQYELRDYAVDLEDLSAQAVAAKIGLPPEQVFKTLLCVTDQGEHLFAVVPADAQLDPKKLASAARVRSTELAPLKNLQPLTGYMRGAVTAFGARKAFPVFADETIELFEVISVSAGLRGMQLLLAPGDYLRASGAAVAGLTRDR